MLVFTAVLTPAFTGGKHKPVAHIGDFGGPFAVLVSLPGAAAQALNDGLDLQEFSFRILRICGCLSVRARVEAQARQRPIQAGTQLNLKVAHLNVLGGLRLQQNKAARVVVNLRQREIDEVNPLFDGFALAPQLRAEIGQFADGVFFEQVFELGFKTRQIVDCQLLQ